MRRHGLDGAVPVRAEGLGHPRGTARRDGACPVADESCGAFGRSSYSPEAPPEGCIWQCSQARSCPIRHPLDHRPQPGTRSTATLQSPGGPHFLPHPPPLLPIIPCVNGDEFGGAPKARPAVVVCSECPPDPGDGIKGSSFEGKGKKGTQLTSCSFICLF